MHRDRKRLILSNVFAVETVKRTISEAVIRTNRINNPVQKKENFRALLPYLSVREMNNRAGHEEIFTATIISDRSGNGSIFEAENPVGS